MEAKISISSILLVDKFAQPITSLPYDEGFIAIEDARDIPVPVFLDLPLDNFARGETFTARVGIDNVVDYDASQYQVSYDPDKLDLLEVTDGIIEETVIPIANWAFSPLGEPGCAFILNNVPGVPGISGSGYLCEIRFRVK